MIMKKVMVSGLFMAMLGGNAIAEEPIRIASQAYVDTNAQAKSDSTVATDANYIEAGSNVAQNLSNLDAGLKAVSDLVGDESVANTIASALGGLGTHIDSVTGEEVDNTVADVLAQKQNKIDENNKLPAAYIDGLPEGSNITVDDAPTQNSENAVSSGGVYAAIQPLNDFNECRANSPSGVCVLASNEDGLLWVPVTYPYSSEDIEEP